MRRSIVRYIRMYFIQAWFAWRSLFAWSTPFNFFVSKFGFTFFSMIMFVFMGKYVGLTDPIYIVIGNILLMPAGTCLSGISMTVGNERQFGAMSYLLGSPAPRAPIFLGRAFFHILDAFITVVIGLLVAILIFHLNMAGMNLLLVLLCVIITSFTTTGMGFIMGSLSLVNRDGWMITSTLSLSLYILAGANFPVSSLPEWIQPVSYALPMTRGVLAARKVLDGAGWGEVSGLLAGEIAIGVVYIAIGYWMFRVLERKSLVSGVLDNV
jgi:ABC-2 type transport system permease protein